MKTNRSLHELQSASHPSEGAKDEIGAANHMNKDTLKEAVKLVKKGKSAPLGIEGIPPLVGQGVIVDMVKHYGKAMEAAQGITVEDVDAALDLHEYDLTTKSNPQGVRILGKKNPRRISPSGIRNKKAAPSYSPTVKTAVPLPQAGLTSEFGMGSGISPPLSAQPKRKTCCSL